LAKKYELAQSAYPIVEHPFLTAVVTVAVPAGASPLAQTEYMVRVTTLVDAMVEEMAERANTVSIIIFVWI
jgi:hypothetical protein